jgi:hypothetical protein
VTRRELVYRYTVGDESVELDWYDLTIDECAELTRVTGYRYPVLAAEHDQGDALAVKAMLWMARRKNGEPDLAFTDESLKFAMRDFTRERVRDSSQSGEQPDPPQPAAPETAPAKRRSQSTSQNR